MGDCVKMGRTYSDKSESDTLKPIIVNPISVNNYDDGTVINFEQELEVGNNIILDDKMIEKVPGTTKGNSDSPGNNPVYALHRAYGKGTEKLQVRLSNGSLKTGWSGFGTTILSGLANKMTPFINIKGKSYGVNETDGLIRIDNKTAVGRLGAIVGPNYRKKIAFFETDETCYGGSADTSAYRPEEWSGNAIRAFKLTATASNSVVGYQTPSPALNLATFSDGKASGEDDYIVFWVKHTILQNINYISIDFANLAGTDYYIYTILPDELTDGDYEWTKIKIKKGDFLTVGTIAWSNIERFDITLQTNANGGTSVTFDFMYLEGSPPTVSELQKKIFGCDDNTEETWTGDGTLTNEEAYEGNKSIYVAGTAGGAARTLSLALATQLDLSKWVDGETVADTDEFVFYIRTNDITALADASCLTLRVGLDSSNYYYYTWATKAALGLISNDTWIEVKVTKGDLDALSVGAPNFTNVDYVAFVTSALTGTAKYIYFDSLSLKKAIGVQVLATMEATESWTFSNTASAASSDHVTEALKSILLANPGYAATDVTATLSWVGAVKDLTQFTGGAASLTSDHICFDIYCLSPTLDFNYLEIWFDNNSLASFANAYKYRFKVSDVLPANDTRWVTGAFMHYRGTLKVAKSLFEQVGTTGAWSTIGAVKFIFNGQTTLNNPSGIYLDNLQLKRKPRQSGIYRYKYCYMVDDIYSACSEETEEFINEGNDVLIKNIKTSADTRVTARKIFRIGGLFPDTWMEVKKIEDNTTTTVIDDLDDNQLILEMSDGVPQGYINSVVGNNLAYEPQSDRLLVWGDPNHTTYIWYSRPGYYLTFDEDSYREMADAVMSVVPWYENDIVFYKHRGQKIAGDVATGKISDIPINIGACSYWSVKPLSNFIAIGSWDNVYKMDGYNVEAIGDRVKGYFKGRESYLSTVNIGFNKGAIYVACKQKTGTPTYNNVVLRYCIRTGSWTVMPGWYVNCWSNWDQSTDQNEFYYGDSVTGNIYSLDSATYLFDATLIDSVAETGWLQLPDSDIAIHKIECRAKGTAASSLDFYGYKNLSATAAITASVTLTTSWQKFTIGPKDVFNILRGDCVKIKFMHVASSAYFKLKDIVIYAEKLSKQIVLNDTAVLVG